MQLKFFCVFNEYICVLCICLRTFFLFGQCVCVRMCDIVVCRYISLFVYMCCGYMSFLCVSNIFGVCMRCLGAV